MKDPKTIGSPSNMTKNKDIFEMILGSPDSTSGILRVSLLESANFARLKEAFMKQMRFRRDFPPLGRCLCCDMGHGRYRAESLSDNPDVT